MPPRSPSRSPSRGSHGVGGYDHDLLAPEPSHPAPPSPAFTNSTIYRTPDDDYSDADTDITGRDGIATPVTVSVSGDNASPPPHSCDLRYEDLPPSYEEAQSQSQTYHAYEQQQHGGTNPTNPLSSPPPSFAESFHTPMGGSNASDPVLPAVERLVIREKERAASEQGSERSAFSGSGGGGADGSGRDGGGSGNGFSFAAVEGLAGEHHGVLEVALQWAHPAYHASDQKEALGGAPLARPVAVPQVNVTEESATTRDGGEEWDENDDDVHNPANLLAFSRAYAPALHQAHGVPLPLFLSFLDGLNAVCHAARAPAIDADDAPDADLSLVEAYLARANALFFAQRGLLVRVVDIDGLLDDVLRLASPHRRSLRAALAHDVARPGASERDRVDALDPWVERLVWDGLPPATLRLRDLRGHQAHQTHQQQRAPPPLAPSPAAAPTTTTPATASGEFSHPLPPNPPFDDKSLPRAWQQASSSSSSSSSSIPPFPPFPPLGPFPGFGSPPPVSHLADGARWSGWGQDVGRRWADWGQQFGRGWAVWGQEVGNRAARWGEGAGRGAFVGGGPGGGHWGGAGRQHRQNWGGGPWGPYGCGGGGGSYGGRMGGRRGFGFAGGRGGRGMGMGMGMGMGGHQLRGPWGMGGGGPYAGPQQQPGTFSGFGQGAAQYQQQQQQQQQQQHDAARSGEAVAQQSHPHGPPYESTTTLGSGHISLEDNDHRDADDDSDRDDDDINDIDDDDDADSDSDLDEIDVSFLKRMRSIEDAAADALAKGKRTPADIARERDKLADKAAADRAKAARKLEARRKKDEGKREMKAMKKEWKEGVKAKGKEGKGKRKAEKKRLKKEWKDARSKWREGRREERVERKSGKRERRAERRSGGCGGGGEGGARQVEQQQQQQQQRGVEVGGAVEAGDGGDGASAAPQLLWVVVENLSN